MKEKINNLGFLKDKKLHNKFFHHLYRDNSRATICILLDENNKLVSRGTSICSSADRFSRREGRDSAMGRAIKAVINRKSSLPLINRVLSCNGVVRSNEAFDEISRVYKNKAEYKPSLDIIPWNM